MTVYELIQELVGYKADTEVYFIFKTVYENQCPECQDKEDIKLEYTSLTVDDIDSARYGKEVNITLSE
jgi:hypothetical protein